MAGRDLKVAGETVGERVWRLPLWDEYLENLDGALRVTCATPADATRARSTAESF